MKRWIHLVVSAVVVLGSVNALADDSGQGWLLHDPIGIEWRVADSLPPGAKIAVLEGDPSKAGFFTMRIKMPDGYRVPPHWHPQQERVTVLAGTLNLGSGNAFEPTATRALSPGTYSSMPPQMTHFAWMTGETVLQLSSIGPWTITYVNPEDDPRARGR